MGNISSGVPAIFKLQFSLILGAIAPSWYQSQGSHGGDSRL
ncbi:MAG: hypothetical protein SAJ12_01805 [Jaaginema sp. PMC 1079.18]|nr:hypothetical protein [Jaaginema sp. PMC 1079.18]